jgi:hypothetical protein
MSSITCCQLCVFITNFNQPLHNLDLLKGTRFAVLSNGLQPQVFIGVPIFFFYDPVGQTAPLPYPWSGILIPVAPWSTREWNRHWDCLNRRVWRALVGINMKGVSWFSVSNLQSKNND